jgi:hypothetical protein
VSRSGAFSSRSGTGEGSFLPLMGFRRLTRIAIDSWRVPLVAIPSNITDRLPRLYHHSIVQCLQSGSEAEEEPLTRPATDW